MPSSRYSSAESVATSYANAHRRNAFEALTGEAPPSVLAESRPSRRPSKSSRTSHAGEAEYCPLYLDDNLLPEDSVSQIGSRAQQDPPRNPSTRDRSTSSTRHREARSKTRGPPISNARYHDTPLYAQPSRHQSEDHIRDVQEIDRQHVVPANGHRRFSFDDEDDLQTPTQKTHASSRSHSRGGSASPSRSRSRSHSRSNSSHNSHAHAQPSHYPPQSFSSHYTRENQVDDSHVSRSTSRSGSKSGSHSSSSRSRSRSHSTSHQQPALDTPPSYRSAPASRHHSNDNRPELNFPQRSASTSHRSRGRLLTDDGLRIGRNDEGRAQWERPSRRKNSESAGLSRSMSVNSRTSSRRRSLQPPRWLLWLTGGL